MLKYILLLCFVASAAAKAKPRFYITNPETGKVLETTGKCKDSENTVKMSAKKKGDVKQLWYKGSNNSIFNMGQCGMRTMYLDNGKCEDGQNVKNWKNANAGPKHVLQFSSRSIYTTGMIYNSVCGTKMALDIDSKNGSVRLMKTTKKANQLWKAVGAPRKSDTPGRKKPKKKVTVLACKKCNTACKKTKGKKQKKACRKKCVASGACKGKKTGGQKVTAACKKCNTACKKMKKGTKMKACRKECIASGVCKGKKIAKKTPPPSKTKPPTKTQKKATKCPVYKPIPGYDLLVGTDINRHDIKKLSTSRQNNQASLVKFAKACSSNKKCKSFNTWGFIKTSGSKKKMKKRGDCLSLYVKKTSSAPTNTKRVYKKKNQQKKPTAVYDKKNACWCYD